MALFNFGKSKTSSQSTSVSDAYGYSTQGSTSLSGSLSQSTSRSVGQSSQRIAFEDLFAQLFGNAGGAAARAAQLAPGLSQQADLLFSGGLNFLDQLQGGGAGEDYLAGRVAGENPLLDQQIDLLGEDIGRFLREEVNPVITSQGVASGTLGGGRQGVAQGLAARAAAEQFQRGATQLRASDLAQRDALAGQLAGLRQQGAAAGLAALPGLFGVAQGGLGAELGVYSQLAQIMGGPTTLTEASQLSTSDAASIARAIAESFGISEDFAQSRSQSTSKGSSFNFGAGFGPIK